MKQRQRQILEFLHDNPGHITAGQLAELLKCSERTIRNEIAELRQLLVAGEYGRLEAKGNQGYRLIATPEEWARLLRQEEEFSQRDLFSQQLEGPYLILERVLKNGTVKISYLEQELFTNYKSIAKYADQAEEWLRRHQVELQRKRGQGITARGNRHQIRLALWALYHELTHTFRPDEVAESLQQFWPGISFYGIQQTVSRLEERWCFRFSYASYERFCFLLAAMLADSRRKQHYDLLLQGPTPDTWEWNAAYDVLDMMRQAYHADLPAEETFYLWFCLASSEIMDFRTPEAQQRNAREKQKMLGLVRVLVRMIGGILQHNFSDDKVLENGLLNYLSALSTALHYGDRSGEHGSVLQSCTEYAEVSVACWSASHLLEGILQTPITEWEVSAIASHFAGAVERKSVGGVVYVICSYGVGVSRFLCEQLKRAFPHIQVLGELTPRDLDRLQTLPRQYDLLITTVDLPGMPSESTVRIGNRLKNSDIMRINKKLAHLHDHPRKKAPASGQGLAYPLFDPGLVLRCEHPVEKEELLHRLCQMLAQRGYVGPEFETTVLEREHNASTSLSSRVAIPHGLPEHVLTSKIAVGLLDVPVKWNAFDQVDTVFLLALNLKSNAQVRESTIAFYRGLIAMVDEPEKLACLRVLPTDEDLAGALNQIVQ